jgi:hypothetical protein
MVFPWGWFGKKKVLDAIHLPWRVGHYVTYFFQRDDSDSWTAFTIRVEARADDGAWILRADFKTRLGESTMWLRSNPDAKPEDIDPVPLHEDLVRGSRPDSREELLDSPTMQSSLALNILLVRRFSGAVPALCGLPRVVRYPCGIDQAHRLVTPGPGYEKHHDLNPRVMVTGVACLSIDDGKNPIVATSFGWTDPDLAGPVSYDDFIDLSHCKSVGHDAFSLSYPATCFLRHQGSWSHEGMAVDNYLGHSGGASCSWSLSVAIRRGDRDQLSHFRNKMLARVTAPQEGPMGKLVPKELRGPGPDGLDMYAVRMVHPSIDGFAHGAIVMDPAGTTLGQVYAFGCVAKANPLRQQTLEEMDAVLPAIAESFRLGAHAP